MSARPATLADLARQALGAAKAPPAPPGADREAAPRPPVGDSPAGHPEAGRPGWRWLIRDANGALYSHSFSPPATLAAVRAWYPGALAIEPEPEPDQEPTPAPALSVEPGPSLALVACCTCRHWRRDTIGDGSGLGRCLADAPASHLPGSLWPRGEIRCRSWEGAA